MRKKPTRSDNLKVVADFTRQNRHSNTLHWAEQWHEDEEVEVVYLGTQDFAYKRRTKIRAETETVCVVI